MTVAILIAVILYQSWIIYWLGKGHMWGCKKDTKQQVYGLSPKKEKQHSIMGKTKTVFSQIKPNGAKQSHNKETKDKVNIFASERENNYPKKVSEDEFEEVFTNTPMEIDVEAEYEKEEVISDEEDIVCSMNGKNLPIAQGVSFDDMNHLAKVMKDKNEIPQEVEKAVETARKMASTELFEKMVVYISTGAPSRVEAALAKNGLIVRKAEKKFVIPEKYEDFNINNIL